MRDAREEPSSSSGHQAVDLISAMKELHDVCSLGLTKLIRDSQNNIIQTFTQVGSSSDSSQFGVEKIARCLPLHLIAKVMLSERDEASYKYLLCGIRLLRSLCDLAPRYPKLELILLDDVKVSEQLLELVFYLLVLSNHRQEHRASSHMPLLHSALVACSMYLLTGCIASQRPDISSVLLAHRQELCREGGVLLLVRSILKLNMTWFKESPSVVAAVFRLKSRVLSILLHLCEAESISYLDEVASEGRKQPLYLRGKAAYINPSPNPAMVGASCTGFALYEVASTP